MTKRLNSIIAVALAVCVPVLAAAGADAPPVAAAQGFVNDRAGVLNAQQRTSLEQKLRGYAEGTPFVQIAVLTVDTLGGEPIEDYALKVFDTWKIGQKGKDNGVLLLVAVKDRKLRIQAGYGVEGKLTDGTCGDIIRYEITPAFKSGDYAGGINAGCEAIAKVLTGEFDASSRWQRDFDNLGEGRFFLGAIVAMIGGGIAGLLWKKHKMGGLLGLIVAIAVIWLLIWSCMAAFFWLFAIIAFMKGLGASGGRSGGFLGGSGGGWSSGGGGGGFGGFGGGSSGGGGASGSW
ncbi:MAG: YgcG family protein [Planctomycetaceae bacterium]|nr:YgcG family protein [Planctomycetaceae bacterium]